MRTADRSSDHPAQHAFRQGSAIAAAAVMTVGVAVLAGWQLGIDQLMTVLPGYIRMKPNTALAFIGAATALLIEYCGGSIRMRRLAAAVPLILGGGTLVQYLTGLSLHIDQLLFLDPVQKMYPGRMAHLTAINFTLVGFALLLRTRPHSTRRASSAFALVVMTSSLFAIVGYSYGVPLLYGSIHYTAMALHTGISFLLLSLAIVFIDPESAVAKLVWSAGAGGVVARRLLPIALIVPILLGRIFTSNTFNGGDLRMAMAFKAMTMTILFGAVVAHLCHTLNVASGRMLVAEMSLQFDALTAIYNRHYCDRRLASEIALSYRYGTDLSLVMFDADHFKKINDVHGHLGGDEVLKAIASVATFSVRSPDAVCRYGGEEFVIILPHTSLSEAAIMADRVRTMISDWVEAATGIPTTISLGVTSLSAEDASPADLFLRADAALYEAKAAGRNCVRTRSAGPYEIVRPTTVPEFATAA